MPSHEPRAKPAPGRASEPGPRLPSAEVAPPTPATRTHAVLRLQRTAGNAATAALVGRLASHDRVAILRQSEDKSAPEQAPMPTPQQTKTPDEAGERGGILGEILGTLSGWARRIPGYGLLGVVIGRDPLSGTPVPRTAVNIVGGFMGLIPGGQAIFENLQRSGAVERAGAWLDGEVPRLGLTWEFMKGLFTRAWDALSVLDLLSPTTIWEKVSAIFTEPVQRLFAFGQAAAGKLLEFVFEGVLSLAGAAGGQVMAIVRRAGDVLGTIVRDPIGFAGNLIGAVRGGLGRFMANIGSHLKTGLFGWLTGAMRGVVALPARFDLPGILSLVLQVLGMTWSWVRKRLVSLLGEPVVATVEKAVDWIKRIATGGLAAVWERITEFASGLVDTVLGGIRDWVGKSVVGAAITKVITMFNPAGAIIQSIIAVYNTVQFFIERAQQLGALATSVFESIAAIATGNLGNAMAAVENAMARTLPVVLGFLARLIGLGDVAGAVKGVIDRVRAVVDKALDKVIDWLVALAKRVAGRGAAPETAPQPTSADASGLTQRAVGEVRQRAAGAGLQEPRALGTILQSVRGELRPQGLRELSARVANPQTMDIALEATINPTSKLLIPWGEVFKAEDVDAEQLQELRANFLGRTTTARDKSFATLTVAGRKIGTQESGGLHAEEKILASDWSRALEAADEQASKSPDKPVDVVLAINRSPCHARCTPQLVAALSEAKARFAHRDPPARVNFILAPTGVYEPTQELSHEEIDAEERELKQKLSGYLLKKARGTTRMILPGDRGSAGGEATSGIDIKRLQSAGWDVRVLVMQERPTPRGRVLEDYLAKLKAGLAEEVNTAGGAG